MERIKNKKAPLKGLEKTKSFFKQVKQDSTDEIFYYENPIRKLIIREPIDEMDAKLISNLARNYFSNNCFVFNKTTGKILESSYEHFSLQNVYNAYMKDINKQRNEKSFEKEGKMILMIFDEKTDTLIGSIDFTECTYIINSSKPISGEMDFTFAKAVSKKSQESIKKMFARILIDSKWMEKVYEKEVVDLNTDQYVLKEIII